jgi:LysR family transcriptional regulator, regulator of abg operon
LRLQTLEAMVLIERHGTIRAVADELHMSQPALTAAIQQLEEELRAPLLTRSKQGVRFTEFGRAFLAHAKSIVAQSRRAKDEMSQLRGVWEGVVKMAVSPAVALGLLPQALRQFTHQYPSVQVECRDGVYPGVAPSLRDGTLDFALTPVHRVDLDSDLVAEPLCTTNVVIVSSKSHPLATSTKLYELQNCSWVLSSAARGPGAIIAEAFTGAGLPPPRVSMSCESFLALPAVVAASKDWMATMPQLLFENCSFKDNLCIVPIEEPLPSLTICAVRRHDLPLTPAALHLIGWIQHVARKYART